MTWIRPPGKPFVRAPLGPGRDPPRWTGIVHRNERHRPQDGVVIGWPPCLNVVVFLLTRARAGGF
jgi:hypothetical protein